MEMVGQGGGLLIGIDLKKDVVRIEAAYNDVLGVTASLISTCCNGSMTNWEATSISRISNIAPATTRNSDGRSGPGESH